jgi:hypothetical protein
MLSCHHVIALDPHGNTMVKQCNAHLLELHRESFSKRGQGNLEISPNITRGIERWMVDSVRRMTNSGTQLFSEGGFSKCVGLVGWWIVFIYRWCPLSVCPRHVTMCRQMSGCCWFLLKNLWVQSMWTATMRIQDMAPLCLSRSSVLAVLSLV